MEKHHGFLQVLLSILLHQWSGTSGNQQSPCFFCERFYPSELTFIHVKSSPFTTYLISCFIISPWHSCLCFHSFFIFTSYFHPATNRRCFKASKIETFVKDTTMSSARHSCGSGMRMVQGASPKSTVDGINEGKKTNEIPVRGYPSFLRNCQICVDFFFCEQKRDICKNGAVWRKTR